MRPTTLENLSKRVSIRLTRRTGLSLLVGAGLPLLRGIDAANAKQKKRITLCVNSQTIKAPKKKAKKLLKQGATRGACPGRCLSSQKACGSGCIPARDCCVNADCTGDDVCENGECVPLRCGNGGTCSVFLASTGVQGSEIGGLSGGDAKCQEAADTAGLDGTFRAWLSAGSATPETRFTNVNQAGPYRLVANDDDGGNPPPLVAANFADLLSCDSTSDICLQSPINRTESGTVSSGDLVVWTGTQPGGATSTDTCGGWTSIAANGLAGITSQVTSTWTAATTFSCNLPGLLYCFQQAT